MKSIPKPFTTARIFFDLMSDAYNSGTESDITDLTNFHGEPIARSSVSMHINKNSKERFPGISFYTRTIKSTGRLVIGCYNPASVGANEESRATDPDPAPDHKIAEPECANPSESEAYDYFMAALER